jgi:thioredoxin-like negative regulator of GroEL
LVDFWGPRYVPWIQLDPFVEELGDRFNGKLVVAKVIAPANRQLCIKLKVMALPSFVAFNSGKEIAGLAGEVNEIPLAEMVHSAVALK